MKHYVHPALQAPDGHCVTVDVIGCGGTGSALLTYLARLHLSLKARGHLGLHVRVFDPDNVETPNLVRQHFTAHDLGRNKAVAALERLNAYYGLNWQAVPLAWDANWVKHPQGFFAFANVIISCVDTVKSRRTIWQQVSHTMRPNWHTNFLEDGSINPGKHRNPAFMPLYWLDLGNSKDIGQVVLSTFGPLPQPTSYGDGTGWLSKKNIPPLRRLHPGHKLQEVVSDQWNPMLPNLFDLFPNLEEFEDKDTTPSCSLLQALDKQSIMVNPMVATAAANLLSQLFTEKMLSHHGCFLNLNTLTMAAVAIPKIRQQKMQLA